MGASGVWRCWRAAAAWLAGAGIVAGLAAGLFGSAAPAVAAGTIAAPTTFSSTGSEQTYTVPGNVAMVEVDVNGAPGGGGNVGGSVGGYLQVSGGQKLYAEVGSAGAFEGGATFGGGGAAGAFPTALGTPPCTGGDGTGSCGGAFAGSGGGASDVRTCSESATSCPGGGTTLDSRLIVAGGGSGQGGGGFTAGFYCTEFPQKGAAWNNQPLPTGNPADGPVPVVVANGIIVPGDPADWSYGGPINGITASQGGAAAPGAGGSASSCNVVGSGVVQDTYSNSLPGAAASGATGGNGASVTGNFSFEGPLNWIPGPGGGGGGGYTGGGGGSTGFVCTFSVKPPCYNPSGGMSGGGGSSFFANSVLGPFTQDGPEGTPSMTFTPIVEIDSPASGAVYKPGQVVHAQWECGHYQGTSCQGATDPVGTAISTTPGTHTFTVTVSPYPTNKPITASVTYTVGKSKGHAGKRGAPSIKNARLTSTRFRAGSGTTIELTLSHAATIVIAVTHTMKGGRTVHDGTLTRPNEAAGSVSIPFSGRVGGRALARGRHVLTLTARDTHGSSQPVTLTFTITG